MIFTWNGSEFQFITDVLGVAPLGASSGDGSTSRWTTTSTSQIPGESLARGGRQVRDPHHRGTERGQLPRPGPADRGGSSGGHRGLHERQVQVAAVSRVPAVRRAPAHLSAAARLRTTAGAMCSPSLLADGSPLSDGSARRPERRRARCTRSTSISAGAAPDNRAVLILNGWVDWADGSTFLAPRRRTQRGLVTP